MQIPFLSLSLSFDLNVSCLSFSLFFFSSLPLSLPFQVTMSPYNGLILPFSSMRRFQSPFSSFVVAHLFFLPSIYFKCMDSRLASLPSLNSPSPSLLLPPSLFPPFASPSLLPFGSFRLVSPLVAVSGSFFPLLLIFALIYRWSLRRRPSETPPLGPSSFTYVTIA